MNPDGGVSMLVINWYMKKIEIIYAKYITIGSFCSNWYRGLFWVKFLKNDDTICNIALKAI